MNSLLSLVSLACLWSGLPAEPFELRDGDRVVLVGSTLIEREQEYGYWETALTTRFPDRNITFRNLGWSGDTVWGEARAGFDTPKEGFRRLVEHTLALKPTVIVLGYGTNESFAGEAGLPAFREQFNKLLDALVPSKARFVLLAPVMFEEPRWRAGQFAERKRDLQLYTDAIRQIAGERGARYVDELRQRYGPAFSMTDNGMHLTAYGYWWTSHGVLNELDLARGTPFQIVDLTGQGPARVRKKHLPTPPRPPETGVQEDMANDTSIRVRDLPPGRYTLKIDGRAIRTDDAGKWLHPERFGLVLVPKGPSLDQAEQLRRAIVEKNRLYFYRWRPQNETYLFGFRKHEQGQNAREVPLFDPLVEQKEKEIAKLRVPVEHVYQLVRSPEGKR